MNGFTIPSPFWPIIRYYFDFHASFQISFLATPYGRARVDIEKKAVVIFSMSNFLSLKKYAEFKSTDNSIILIRAFSIYYSTIPILRKIARFLHD